MSVSGGLRGLGRRAIRSRRARAALVVAGVGASTLLVVVLFATYRNLTTGIRNYLDRPELDLWVAPEGTDNLVRSSGLLPLDGIGRIRAVPGVGAAAPVLRAFAAVQSGSDAATLLVIGYELPGGAGGPPAYAAGAGPARSGEVAVDRAAAFRLGVEVGDTVRLNRLPARVVGLTQGTNLLATQFLFADLQDAQRMAGASGRASFLVVRLEPGADPDVVARRLEAAMPGTEVFSREAFIANNLREVAAGFVPILALVTLLGLVVAALLVSLLVHGLVEERRADIAVMLAMGARPGAIGWALVLHVGTLILIGCVLGALAAYGLRFVLDRALPTIELAYRLADLGGVVALFVAAGVLAALIPVVRLRRVDPLEAFRS